MDEFNTCEYGAEQKSEGKWLLIRIAFICTYVLLVAGYFVFLYTIRIIPLFAITPIWLWILCHFTWRYTKPDYRYYIEKGTFSFYVCYGKKAKKKKVEFTVSAAKAIAPKDTISDLIASIAPANVYSAVPSVKSNDVYAAVFTNKEGKDSVIYFVATSSALKLLKFYNSATVVTQTSV